MVAYLLPRDNLIPLKVLVFTRNLVRLFFQNTYPSTLMTCALVLYHAQVSSLGGTDCAEYLGNKNLLCIGHHRQARMHGPCYHPGTYPISPLFFIEAV